MITRKEYMKDSENLHQKYYEQFIIPFTRVFIEDNIGLEKLKASKDKYFNDIIKHRFNTWIWDSTPINLDLLKEAGEVNSQSVHTCVGKACARMMLNEVV